MLHPSHVPVRQAGPQHASLERTSRVQRNAGQHVGQEAVRPTGRENEQTVTKNLRESVGVFAPVRAILVSMVQHTTLLLMRDVRVGLATGSVSWPAAPMPPALWGLPGRTEATGPPPHPYDMLPGPNKFPTVRASPHGMIRPRQHRIGLRQRRSQPRDASGAKERPGIGQHANHPGAQVSRTSRLPDDVKSCTLDSWRSLPYTRT
jgi:hypothetical protein